MEGNGREATMRRLIGVALFGLLISPLPILAQAMAPGKYSGRMEFIWPGDGRRMSEMVTLTIDKVEGDRFEGIAWVGIRACQVDTPVRGRLEGDVLKVRGAPVKEKCGINWDLKVDGNKLEGKSSTGSEIKLSK
jgi:hypothetical protein